MKYPSDRITDNRSQWFLRREDHRRADTPRQRRLRAQRQFLIARYHEAVSMILGGIALTVFVVVLFFV